MNPVFSFEKLSCSKAFITVLSFVIASLVVPHHRAMAMAPVISSVGISSSTATAITVEWNTDTAAISQINYGDTDAYGSASSSSDFVTSHFITISGLTASSTYHLQVVAANGDGNTSTSSDQVITTEPTGSVGVSTLAQLAANIKLNPSGSYDLLSDYDASVDGTYQSAIIPTTFTGTFNGNGHVISNISISDPLVGRTDALFSNIGTGGVVKNLTLAGGSISSTGIHVTNISASNQVAALAAKNFGTVTNVLSTVAVSSATGEAQVGGLVSENYASGLIQNVQCNGAISITADAFNTYESNCVGLNVGHITGASVTSGSLFAPSGTSSHPNLNCSSAPCPTTGAWMGPIAGANGLTKNSLSTALIENSFATIPVVNSANVNAANFTGGLVGNNLDAAIRSSYATGAVSGASSAGGFVGYTEEPTSSIQSSYATGNVKGTATNIGGFAGKNTGNISQSYAAGNVSGTINIGGFIGTNIAGASIDHAFAFGTASGTTFVGGFAGGNQGTMSQSYSLGTVSGTTNLGGYIGSDSNDAGISLSYWDTTTSGLTRGAGSVVNPVAIVGLNDATFKGALPSGFDSSWIQDPGVSGGYPYLRAVLNPSAPSAPKMIVLHSTGSWSVPSDWNSANNSIEAIGEGGNGANATVANAGRGGGGGAYAKIKNFAAAAGQVIPVTIGTGGTGTNSQFNGSSTLIAAYGSNGSITVSGAGGSIASSVGSVRYAGGNGQTTTNNCSGAGGGGAAGPNGAGKNAGSAAGTSSQCGGGGGGASDLGSIGLNGSSSQGGNGGAAYDGTQGGSGSSSSGTSGTNGLHGSGAGAGLATAAQASSGGVGGSGQEYGTSGAGGGGGGGGGLATVASGGNGGNGGNYGAGGGGGGRAKVTPGIGGQGAPGLIVITYTPVR